MTLQFIFVSLLKIFFSLFPGLENLWIFPFGSALGGGLGYGVICMCRVTHTFLHTSLVCTPESLCLRSKIYIVFSLRYFEIAEQLNGSRLL